MKTKQKRRAATSKALDSALLKAARAAGRLHGKALRQSLRDNAANQGNFSKSARKALQRLQAQRQITSDDAGQLREIMTALDGNITITESLSRARSIYKHLLRKREASPLAVAIAGIAVDSLKTAEQSGSLGSAASSGNSSGGSTARADVNGALLGGVLGLTAGALVGAVAGAGVGLGPGAAVGALAGAVAGGAAASAQQQNPA